MIFFILLMLMLIVGILLGVIILLQSGKGGGLAAMGGGAGTDTLIGGRQAATLLTKATWAGGGIFLFLSLVLSILSSRQATPDSILREEFRQGAQQAAPAPILPGTDAGATSTTGTPQGPVEQPPTTTQ